MPAADSEHEDPAEHHRRDDAGQRLQAGVRALKPALLGVRDLAGHQRLHRRAADARQGHDRDADHEQEAVGRQPEHERPGDAADQADQDDLVLAERPHQAAGDARLDQSRADAERHHAHPHRGNRPAVAMLGVEHEDGRENHGRELRRREHQRHPEQARL